MRLYVTMPEYAQLSTLNRQLEVSRAAPNEWLALLTKVVGAEVTDALKAEWGKTGAPIEVVVVRVVTARLKA